MTLLEDHFRRAQDVLLAQFEAARSFDAKVDIGQAREIFIDRFLREHLPPKALIGKGEIVDSQNSRSGQVDVIVYRDDLPKLRVADRDVFLCEGVYCTVEVKSSLDKERLFEAMDGVRKVKALERLGASGMFVGVVPSKKIRSYIFAYSSIGMNALRNHIGKYIKERGIKFSDDGFDMLCVLRKGVIVKNDDFFFKRNEQNERYEILSFDISINTLLLFFLHLLKNVSGLSVLSYDYSKYLSQEILK